MWISLVDVSHTYFKNEPPLLKFGDSYYKGGDVNSFGIRIKSKNDKTFISLYYKEGAKITELAVASGGMDSVLTAYNEMCFGCEFKESGILKS